MPRFSIVTPLAGTSLAALEACARSVRRQTEAEWEWVITLSGQPAGHIMDFLRRTRGSDARVRFVIAGDADDEAALINQGLETASGDFVVLLDPHDELEVDALARFGEVFDAEPEADWVYADELVFDRARHAYDRSFKPAWSPDRLRCHDYVGRAFAVRRALLDEVGRLDAAAATAMWHDLALRLGEASRRTLHVTAPLVRRNSPVAAPDSDDHVRVVRAHCDRVGVPVESVEPAGLPGVVHLRRAVVGEPKVSVIIPSFGPTAPVRGEERSLLESIVSDLVHRTSYRNLEILVVPDPDSPADVMARVSAIDPVRVRVVDAVPRPFNYSVKVNVGAAHATGEYLLFLNDDTEVTHPDWLEPMLAIAQQPDVGMVGAYLRFEDESIQHAGVFLHGGPGHVAFKASPEEFSDQELLAVDRECITITGACMLMPYDVYDELGGHTLILPSNWDDVDLGLKVVTSGRRVVWTPHARLYHFESMSRDPWVQYFELLRFWGRWAAEVLADPYFTPPVGPSSYAWPATRWR